MTAIAKPTVNDIARHAGVSLATVDRVLNARPGVRTVTIDRVNNSISELGYIRDTAAANLARRRVYRLVFLIPDNNSEFFDSLQSQIVAQAAALLNEKTRLQSKRITAFDSHSVVAALDELDLQDNDGIAFIGPETPAIRDAVGRARDKGIVVVALLSDLPSSRRDHFVGIDNTLAGKTAAQLMGRFIKADSGSVLMLTDSTLARDHLERRYGFDSVMSDRFPQFNVLPSIEARDNSELLKESLSNAFDSCSDMKGVYASMSSNAGLIDFLKQQASGLIVIAHELTPLSRDALQRGLFDALISQDTGHIVRSAVRLMRASVDSVPYNVLQERISIDIFLNENLPPEPC